MADLKFSIEQNGVKVTYPDTCTKNSLQMPSVAGRYEALQFHIHLSSEHTIDDDYFGAELHIVHKATNAARYAVVGIMIEPSSPTNNELFGSLLEKWMNVTSYTHFACGLAYPEIVSPSRSSRQSTSVFNVYDLLAENSTFYTYDGGLTTPPVSPFETNYRYPGRCLCALFLLTDSAFRSYSARKLCCGTLLTSRSNCRSYNTKSSFPLSLATLTRPASLQPLHR
jgi:Eukaryotic-type carbonic anhydrase